MVCNFHILCYSLFKVALCVMVIFVTPEWHKLNMPEPMEKFVELNCHIHDIGLGIFLAYSFLIVVCCGYLAFKTRSMKDNFNESGYISLFLSTTLVIWSAMIPAYIVAARENHKILLLNSTLILNQGASLLLVFFPKVYAIKKFEEGAEVVSTPFRSATSSGSKDPETQTKLTGWSIKR